MTRGCGRRGWPRLGLREEVVHGHLTAVGWLHGCSRPCRGRAALTEPWGGSALGSDVLAARTAATAAVRKRITKRRITLADNFKIVILWERFHLPTLPPLSTRTCANSRHFRTLVGPASATSRSLRTASSLSKRVKQFPHPSRRCMPLCAARQSTISTQTNLS